MMEAEDLQSWAMLILASSSPRRSELLRNAGIECRVEAANVPEIHRAGETPEDYVRRLARNKAETVAAKNGGQFVLGADTVVIVDHHILEKPESAEHARRMLRMLSGRTHEVTTGVCLIDRAGTADVRAETTLVTFSKLSDDEIKFYVGTGEPIDRAGAYAIQGFASRWAARVNGNYFNVVGLPVSLVYKMLREAGAV
jgi:septum formation protein